MIRNDLTAIEIAVAKFEELLEKRKSKKIIRYPEIFSIFSWYHIKKQEARRALIELEKEGKIKNVPFHGVRVVRK
jgi:hypothetical protein